MPPSERPLVSLPKGADGLYIEPNDPDWVMLEHNRERAIKHFNYADEFCGDGNTFDPLGRYNCGRCNQVERKTDCQLVDINRVHPEAGSCWDWESQRSGDPEFKNLKRKDAAVAGYGQAKNGVGFGCSPRCPYSKAAKTIDSLGRDMWCGELGFHVMHNGCCVNNGAALVKGGAEGSPSDQKRREIANKNYR